jgi:hypothetical protein
MWIQAEMGDSICPINTHSKWKGKSNWRWNWNDRNRSALKDFVDVSRMMIII